MATGSSGKSSRGLVGLDDYEQVSQLTFAERMVRVMATVTVGAIGAVAKIVVVLTLAGHFGLENKTRHSVTIMMMMRENGMCENDTTCQCDHYFCQQIPHYMILIQLQYTSLPIAKIQKLINTIKKYSLKAIFFQHTIGGVAQLL